MSSFLLGQSVRRSEDLRLVTGAGCFTDDMALPRQAFLHVLRSPHAAARIRGMDTRNAEAVDGVVGILTGQDAVADGLGGFTSAYVRHRPDGSPGFEPFFPVLGHVRVNHAGFPVAAVIAETADIAQDAAEKIEVDYETLPAVIDGPDALLPDAPKVWDEAEDNISFLYKLGDKEAVDAAFAGAHHIASLDFRVTRVSASPLEGRNAIGDWDPREQRYTLYLGCQAPHRTRAELARSVLKIPQSRLRVVAPDVGGAFGMKNGGYPEWALVLWAARRFGRPVRWQATRSESFLSDCHARDNHSTAELALDAAGNFLALRVTTLANLGAYLAASTKHCPTNNLGGLAGTYRTPHIYAHVTGVFSNTNPTSAYRGAGRPEASYAIERVIDHAAREMGIDRIELRRRNMIPPEAMPFKTGLVFTYDSGEFEKNMDAALELSRWATFEDRRREAAARGMLRGIGLASVIEIAGGPSPTPYEEGADIRIDAEGGAQVLVGSHSQGQGLETVFAQIVHDALGIPFHDIRVSSGDTDRIYFGAGTFGSRSAAAGGTALREACERILAKARRIAAHALEADEAEIEVAGGTFAVRGANRYLTLAEIADLSFKRDRLPAELELGLNASAIVAAPKPTFPNSCHVAEVEIDPATGTLELVGYWVAEDVGRVLNPMIVKGQVHGGIAQGLGQALMEEIVFDGGTGQLLTGSFLDYGMPRAGDMPPIAIESNEVPTTANPLGVKGAGESGTVGSIPAVMNAVNDALTPLGVASFDMPATPERIWRAIRAAGGSPTSS